MTWSYKVVENSSFWLSINAGFIARVNGYNRWFVRGGLVLYARGGLEGRAIYGFRYDMGLLGMPRH